MSTITHTSPLHITPTAITEIRKLREQNNLGPDAVLRIGVKGGGCSGMSYLLAFDQQTDSDNIYEIEDVKVVMNKAHEMYVIGMQVNWEDGLNSRGFTFTNPNAKDTCGCGTSFSV
ncbi:MAG: iron-sulfur cluster assembly accessory protein [Flavobacteriaceae bacterium]|nr:iron-sulfur cluster assembly accessory protein [Flavobacteriaceae bacterium]